MELVIIMDDNFKPIKILFDSEETRNIVKRCLECAWCDISTFGRWGLRINRSDPPDTWNWNIDIQRVLREYDIGGPRELEICLKWSQWIMPWHIDEMSEQLSSCDNFDEWNW